MYGLVSPLATQKCFRFCKRTPSSIEHPKGWKSRQWLSFTSSLIVWSHLLPGQDTFSTQSRMLITMTSVKILLQLFIPGSVITFWGRSNTCMYLTLDELADCFIIEILDFLPRDPFLYIFLLKCNLTNIFKEAPEENSTHRSCNFLPRKAHKGLEIVHGRNKLLSDLSRSSRKISILLNSFDNLFFYSFSC